MALRTSLIAKSLLLVAAVLMTIYTLQLYMDMFDRWSSDSKTEMDFIENAPNNAVQENPKEMKKIPETAQQKEEKVFPCKMKQSCKENDEISFRIISGAANIIGPSICVNNKWLLSNTQNNVKRGLNVAVVGGKTGEMSRLQVFDLYAGHTTELQSFLKQTSEDEILFFAVFDEASQALDDATRNMVTEFGSEKFKHLGFRDNWIFVGGKRLKKPTGLEEYLKNEPNKNKFDKWPGTLTLEGCIPKFR